MQFVNKWINIHLSENYVIFSNFYLIILIIIYAIYSISEIYGYLKYVMETCYMETNYK